MRKEIIHRPGIHAWETAACTPFNFISGASCEDDVPDPGGLRSNDPNEVTCPVCLRSFFGWHWDAEGRHLECTGCDRGDWEGHAEDCCYVLNPGDWGSPFAYMEVDPNKIPAKPYPPFDAEAAWERCVAESDAAQARWAREAS